MLFEGRIGGFHLDALNFELAFKDRSVAFSIESDIARGLIYHVGGIGLRAPRRIQGHSITHIGQFTALDIGSTQKQPGVLANEERRRGGTLDILYINTIFSHDLIQYSQGQVEVGALFDLNPLVAIVRRCGAHGIDAQQLGAIVLCLQNDAPCLRSS